MYTDILDQVTGSSGGGTGRGGRSGGRGSNPRSGSHNNDSNNDEIIVRFKAGRISLQRTSDVATATSADTININEMTTVTTGNADVCSTDDDTTTAPPQGSVANKENEQKFHCVSRPERGEVRLVKSTSSASSHPSYSWQWYSRNTENVVESISLLPTSESTKMKHTFERVTLPGKKIYEEDRVYVWTQIPSSSKKKRVLDVVEEIKPKYKMYWMQDADPRTDDTIVTDVNKFFADVVAAANAATAAAATATTSSTAATTSQVDALSSILENLGMPQNAANSINSMDTTSDVDSPVVSSAATTGRNQLTLADLQGAMASIQQQQQRMTVGPPLQDLVTSQSIDAIMTNPEARQRLLQYLPPDQQSEDFLRENLSSSSMQSTLRSLTQMLIQQQDDDTGSAYTEYSNIIANFQLDPQDGEAALLQNNNPIEAFLNCIIASVEKEKDLTATNPTTEETEEVDAAETATDGDHNKKDEDDDVQMNE